MRSVLTFAVMTLAAIAACATPNFDDSSPLPIENAPTGKPATGAAPAGSGSSAVMAPVPSGSPVPAPDPLDPDGGFDAGPQSMRWKASLAATTPVEFGGGQACLYRITLQQVNVDIVAAANGDIVAANVTAIAFEEVLSTPCDNVAIPAHTHTYALETATLLPSGVGHLELAPLATNHPPASLVIEGDFRVPSPSLSLAWHRTDYGPPLDWRVNAQLTATLQ
jgi:hypothetical protein